MSLLRLLSAGRSLDGLKDKAQKYQVPRQSLMPTFGPKQNPFRRTALPENGPVAPPEKPGAWVATPGAIQSGEPQSPDAAASQAHKQEAASAPARPEPASLSPVNDSRGWAGKVGRWFGRGRSDRRRPGARGPRALVQGELCLENVTVVRNDLNDSDLEVVARPAEPEPAGATLDPLPARQAWSRVGQRLFGPGNT